MANESGTASKLDDVNSLADFAYKIELISGSLASCEKFLDVHTDLSSERRNSTQHEVLRCLCRPVARTIR